MINEWLMIHGEWFVENVNVITDRLMINEWLIINDLDQLMGKTTGGWLGMIT